MTDGSDETGRRPVLRGRQGVGRTGARFPRRADVPETPDDDVVAPAPRPDGPAPDPLVGRTGARFASRARRARRDGADGPAALPPGAAPLALPPGPSSASSVPAASGPEPAPDAADPLLGRTGARFDSRARRARRKAEREAAEDAVVNVQAAPVRRRVEIGRGPVVPAPRAAPSAARVDAVRLDAVRPDARHPDVRRPDVRRPDALRSDDDAPTAPLHLAELRNRSDGIEPRVSVRPYVRTRGRTHARADLRVETLVSIPSPRRPVDDPEHRVISDLCDGPRSVAEVAALMGVPLGVARILIGDMADQGTLTVHRTLDRLGPGPGPDGAVMARVLRGLRAL